MKLWQKIFLYTLMLVMLAISVTSILLLKNSYSLTLEQEKQAAYTEHKFLVTNFKSMLLSERLRQNVVMLRKKQVVAYMEDIFEEEDIENGIAFYNRNFTLAYENPKLKQREQGTEEQQESEVSQLLELVEETRETYMQTRGEYLYIVSREELEKNIYYFLTVTDMSKVMTMYRDILNGVRVAGIVCAAIIAVVLLIVIKQLLLPLQKMNQGTKAIAQGDYNLRVPEKGKDELSELAHNMNRMAQAVEKNIHALENVAEDRKQFINNLSHEIKTPLTSILGFSDLLLIKGDLTEEKRKEYAGIIKDEATRMRTLSGKLMEIITVGEANIEWREEEIQEVFEEIFVSLDVVAKSRNMRLSCACEKGRLWIDKELIKSLVYNLTDNAIKASKEGDIISIQGWFEKETFFFTVTDAGIGIPEEEIEKITQAFYMVDKVRSRASGGAGLGLALCMEIAKLHQGNISIESQQGKGTTVTVCMKGGKAYEEC